MNSKSELKRMCTMDPVLMAEKLHETQRKLEVAVEALTEIAEYKEFQPAMMKFRMKNGEFENFGRFARQTLLAIQGKQVGK